MKRDKRLMEIKSHIQEAMATLVVPDGESLSHDNVRYAWHELWTAEAIIDDEYGKAERIPKIGADDDE